MPKPRTPLETLALLPPAARRNHITRMGAEALRTDWATWALPGQIVPQGEWRTWLLMAGRGFGKTRAGAEWVRGIAERNSAARIALVGATLADARAIMVEGESGLLAIAPRGSRPKFEASLNRLRWPNGALAMLYSGESPDMLRGPEQSHAWCDELAKWAFPQATWDMLQMGLRLGDCPQALITTTPRPLALLRALMVAEGVVVTGGATRDNPFLPTRFVEAMMQNYGGTRLGRQELDGDLLNDLPGALWSRELIEAARVRDAGTVRRVVVAVDPPAGVGRDACGIIACGLLEGQGVSQAVVLEDASVHGATPEGWARAVADCVVRHQADRVVAEANQGGAMVAAVLRGAGLALPVRLVHASRGKVARAEPVAALYEAGRVRHAGAFPALEDELCGLMLGGGYEKTSAIAGTSPDRADALVYALTALLLEEGSAVVRARGL